MGNGLIILSLNCHNIFIGNGLYYALSIHSGPYKMTSKATDYTRQVQTLNDEQRERVLSRMAGKLPKRLAKEKLTEEEAIAIQLALEDEQLQEWRGKVATIRAKEGKKKTSKA